MEYRVEELAQSAGVRVDTLRFYQARGLLPPPERRGRVAVYGPPHRERLERIRELQREGFTLAQIGRILERETGGDGELLTALARERVGERTLSRAELASESRVPEALLQAVEAAGLIEPVRVDGEERFGESELEMIRVAMTLLESGFPLHELLGHAVGHAEHVQRLCDASVELFDAHVRSDADDAEVTRIFETLLPKVTRLVALHFQRTLVNRALGRLRGKDEHGALRAALEATENARLEVEVGWR